MTSSIFAGFLKYPKTDRQTPLENQTTELLAAILRRSEPLCREFVAFLCEEAGLKELNMDTLKGVQFKISTQELARWKGGTGYMDLVIKGEKNGSHFIYICVEVKIEAKFHGVCLSTPTTDGLEDPEEEAELLPQINGYEEHVSEMRYENRLVGVLAKRTLKWEPLKERNELVPFNVTWMGLAARLRKSRQSYEEDPVIVFLINEFLGYFKEGGIAVSEPFSRTEFEHLGDTLSFLPKLMEVVKPVYELRYQGRQVSAEFEDSAIFVSSDIHWQRLKAGVRLRTDEKTDKKPEFFIELKVHDEKWNVESLRNEMEALIKKYLDGKGWKSEGSKYVKELSSVDKTGEPIALIEARDWFEAAVNDLTQPVGGKGSFITLFRNLFREL